MNDRELGKTMFERIDYDSLMETVRYFSTLSRQTGTVDGEAAAAYIIRKLQNKGVDVCEDRPLCYASIPKQGRLKVTAPDKKEIYAHTDCFSAAAENIRGEMYYDEISERKELTPKDNQSRFELFKDKIVLTWELDEDFYYKAKLHGAKGIVRINFTEADEVMIYGVSKVWGVPVPENFMFMDVLPVVVIRRKDGNELIEAARAGIKTELCVTTDVENGIFEYTMPSAYIPGAGSDNYILVAAHYDGWFKSVTDNSIAAAMIVELAGIAKQMQSELKRGIRFVWLAGHENVPYAGSTWYADEYFEELKKHCIGYVNIDVIGNGIKNSRMFVNTTRMEGNEFADDIIEEITGKRPDTYIPMVHAADQSFWGVKVPLDIMMNCGNPGWWYHTEADSLDKMDMDIAKRDINFYTELIGRIINSPQLPVDMMAFLGEVEAFMNELRNDLGEEFDIKPALKSIDMMKIKLEALEKEMASHTDEDLDEIYMNIAGELSRICCSSSDGYEYKMSGGGMMSQPVGDMFFAAGINGETAGKEDLLCYRTKFIRLRNRFTGEMEKLADMIDLQMLKWEVKQLRTGSN